MLRRTLVLTFLLNAGNASATTQSTWPMKIPAPGGEVILPDERAKQAYDEYHFAAARRVDHTLYISGVIVGRRDNEGRDVQAFKLQTRRAFERLHVILEASGASFRDVVMINSFHIWNGPNFTGSRDEQFKAFEEVASEFFPTPYPAWTAVGSSGLLADNGIVEVQMIVRIPGEGDH